MKRLASTIFLPLAILLLGTQSATATGKIGSRLTAVMNASSSTDEIVAWVYLTDKGSNEMLKSAVPQSVVSARSLQRRMKVRAENELVDYTDLPVEERYVDEISARVIRVRQRSKWFNSVSVVATKEQIAQLEALPFVSSIELVARWTRSYHLEEGTETQDQGALPHTERLEGIYTLNYGLSLNQVQMINVPAVHDGGNYAQGVMVGVFDNGVRLLNHQAFDSMSIVAMYDFVDHKVSVVPNNTSLSFGSHGVNTLSLIGGYKPGTLIGPAFGADFILARTENDSSETPIEEDYWAAAIEWADSIGVDVTSTSLGYLGYDFPYPSWTWEDMDGNTTVITRAADMAVARGIVVLNSAGNSGSGTHNTLGAPADGDSVLAVGALNSSGVRSSYSSVGPTTSIPPRIKPDIMAQGSNPVYASGGSTTGFSTGGSGTSYSCPIAAGAAALIIKARPNATAIQVINALKSTASNAASPNNLIGWGTVNTVAAINSINPTGTPSDELPASFQLKQNFPNPFNPKTTIQYTVGSPAFVTLKVYDLLGREVRTLVSETQSARTHSAVWDGTDSRGRSVASGMYIYRLSAAGSAGSFSESRTMMFLK